MKEKDFVICPICNKKFKQLSLHVRMTHNLSREEFLKLYPETKMVCDTTHERKLELNKEWKRRFDEDPEFHDSIVTKGRERMAKHRDTINAAIRKSHKLNPQKRINSGKKAAQKRLEFIRTPEGKQKLRDGKLNSKLFKETHSKAAKKTLARLWKDPEFVEARKRKKGFGLLKEYTLPNGDVVKARSKLEVEIHRQITELNISYEYETLCIPYEYEGKSHIYHPDFYIEEYNLIIEGKVEKYHTAEINIVKSEACKNLGYNFIFYGYEEIKNNLLKSFITDKGRND